MIHELGRFFHRKMPIGLPMKSRKALFLSLFFLCVGGLFACRKSNSAGDSSGPRILWSYNTGADFISGVALSPNGNVHFAATNGVYALSPEGKLVWKSPLPSGPVIAAPTISPTGTVYGASQSGTLFSLDDSGALTWQSLPTQSKFFTPVSLGSGDTLYVTDDFTNLFAFSPSTGPGPLWRQMTFSATGSRNDILLGNTTPYYPTGPAEWRSSAVSDRDDLTYLAHQQWLYRLNVHGDVIAYTHLPAGQLGFPAIGEDGVVYVDGRNSPWLFAVGLNFELRWSLRLSHLLRGSPVVDTTGVIYLCDSDFVKAVTPEGQQKWWVQAECNSGPALAADGTIYLGMNSREAKGAHTPFLAAFTPAGELKWKLEINGTILDAPAIAPDGTIFFTTERGSAYAISGADSPPMDSSWPRFQHDAQNSGRSRF